MKTYFVPPCIILAGGVISFPLLSEAVPYLPTDLVRQTIKIDLINISVGEPGQGDAGPGARSP